MGNPWFSQPGTRGFLGSETSPASWSPICNLEHQAHRSKSPECLGFFPPIWKICNRQIGSFHIISLGFRGWNQKCLKPPPSECTKFENRSEFQNSKNHRNLYFILKKSTPDEHRASPQSERPCNMGIEPRYFFVDVHSPNPHFSLRWNLKMLPLKRGDSPLKIIIWGVSPAH